MDYYCPLVSVEMYGHDSGIILYMINGSRAHLLIQFSLFSLYSNQYTHLYRFARASIRLSPPTLSLPVSPHRQRPSEQSKSRAEQRAESGEG